MSDCVCGSYKQRIIALRPNLIGWKLHTASYLNALFTAKPVVWQGFNAFGNFLSKQQNRLSTTVIQTLRDTISFRCATPGCPRHAAAKTIAAAKDPDRHLSQTGNKCCAPYHGADAQA